MAVDVAILGGLVGGSLMMLMLYPARAMAPDQMKMDFLLIVGTMFVPAGAAAYAAGLGVHVVMSALFGIVHGSLPLVPQGVQTKHRSSSRQTRSSTAASP